MFKLFAETLENKNQTVDADNWTPLHHAASGGHLKLCRYIVDSGADKKPIGRGIHLGYTRWPGYTPLNIAAAEGRLRTCILFIDEWGDLIQVLKGIWYTKNQNVFIGLISMFYFIFIVIAFLVVIVFKN